MSTSHNLCSPDQLGRSKDGNIHQNILVQGCPCFFLQKSTKPSLLVLSGDNLVQDMTYWGLEGDVQGLTLEINHTHICADFSLNKYSSVNYLCLPRKKIVILGFAQITPTPTLKAIWATFSTFFVPRRGWMRSNNM